MKQVLNATRRKLRPTWWAKRIAGVAIAVSGGSLLAADLVRMVTLASP